MDVARVVDGPADTVWPLVARPARWTEWAPSVTDVDCADAEVRAGTTGRVRSVAGPWLPFVVTQVTPGRTWAWAVAGVPATGHRVEPLGPRRCRVVFEVPWWAAPYALVCRRALHRIAGIVEVAERDR